MKTSLFLLAFAAVIATTKADCCSPDSLSCCNTGHCNIFCCNCDQAAGYPHLCDQCCLNNYKCDWRKECCELKNKCCRSENPFHPRTGTNLASNPIAYFKAVDTNHDGLIQKEEAAAYFGISDGALANFGTRFNATDLNGDGVIQPGEFDKTLA